MPVEERLGKINAADGLVYAETVVEPLDDVTILILCLMQYFPQP